MKNFLQVLRTKYEFRVKRPLLVIIFSVITLDIIAVNQSPDSSVGKWIYKIPAEVPSESITCQAVVEKNVVKEKGNWITVSLKDGVLQSFRAEGYCSMDVVPGDLLEITALFTLPNACGNPGCFDALSFYATRGTSVIMNLQGIKRIGAQQTPLRFASSIVSYLEKTINNALPKEEAGMVIGILIGDTSYMDEEWKSAFRQTGIGHIFAVSGLHIQTFFFLISSCFSKLFGKRKSAYITLPILWLYVFITGFSVSAVRAALLQSFHSASSLFYREEDPILSIGSSMLIILFINPLYVKDASFLLSFGATISIRFLTPVIQNLFFIPKRFRNILAPSFSVTLGTTPISVWFYHNFCIFSPILNLLVIPLMSLIFPFALFGAVLSCFGLGFGKPLLFGAFFLLKMYEGICLLVMKIPGAVSHPEAFCQIKMIAYYLILVSFIYFIKLPRKKRTVLKKTLLIILVVSASVLLFPSHFIDEVVFLNVGQGDSAYIQWNGKIYLMDCGPNYEYNIKPFLFSKGINTIEGIFMSHPDSDHAEGILTILSEDDFEVKNLYMANSSSGECELRNQILLKAKENNVSIHYWSQGDHINNGKEYVYCLWPDGKQKNLSENDNSMVLLLKINHITVLWVGDLEENGEKMMLSAWGDSFSNPGIHLLKVGHHGSSSSSSELFLSSVMPQTAIISSRKKVYGHPHKETLKRLNKFAIQYYITEQKGAIIIKRFFGFYQIRCYKTKEVYYERIKRAN